MVHAIYLAEWIGWFGTKVLINVGHLNSFPWPEAAKEQTQDKLCIALIVSRGKLIKQGLDRRYLRLAIWRGKNFSYSVIFAHVSRMDQTHWKGELFWGKIELLENIQKLELRENIQILVKNLGFLPFWPLK